MASTYTTNIRLTKQGDGDNPNTWGTVLNNQVISLVDEAIGSYTTVSIGATATVTLTNNEGSSDEARSAFLEVQGTVGSAQSNITLIVPAVQKGYVIVNKTTITSAGAFVKIKPVGGAAVTIPSNTATSAAISHYVTDNSAGYFLNHKGVPGLGTAAVANIAVSGSIVNAALTPVSVADTRYLQVSASVNATLTGTKVFVGASVTTPGNIVVGTNARTYNPITTVSVTTSMSLNFAIGNNFLISVAGSIAHTLKAPANCTAGQSGNIYLVQVSGNGTLAYNSVWQFVSASVPTLTTTANAVDILTYAARSATTIDAVLLHKLSR
jgi:hypothetical protein